MRTMRVNGRHRRERRRTRNSKEKKPMKVRAFVLAASLLLSGSFATMAHAQAASRSVMGPIWVEMTTSPTALEWSSFKAPANGNLIITVTGTVNYEHTQGT